MVEKNFPRVRNDILERGEFQTRGLNGQEKTKIGFVKRAGDGNLRRLPDNRATSLPLPESIRRFCRYNCPYISRGKRSKRSFYRRSTGRRPRFHRTDEKCAITGTTFSFRVIFACKSVFTENFDKSFPSVKIRSPLFLTENRMNPFMIEYSDLQRFL